MDQHLREGALLYLSNSKQWNFGRFLTHLDTLPSFPKDKKSRHELGTGLWRSLLMDYAGDDSHPEKRLKALQELANIRNPMAIGTKNTAIANLNYTGGNNYHIRRCGKAGHPDLVVPPPSYELPILPQAPATGCSKLGLCDGLNKASKSPISPSSPPSPTPQSSTENPGREIARASEQVHNINYINTNDTTNLRIEATPLSSASPRDEFAVLDSSGLAYGDFPEFLGDDTAELLATFEFGGTYEESNVAQLSLATDNPMEQRVVVNANIDEKETNAGLQGELRYTSHTPGARVPSFSGFDALRDDCGGCCLHRYPPTQSLYSHPTAPTAPVSSTPSPPQQTRVASPQSFGAQTPRVYIPPVPAVHTSARIHTPISRDDLVPEVHPMTVVSAALSAVRPSQNLKRTLDTALSCQQCEPTSTLTSDPQADTRNIKTDKAMKNIRKLLEMQKTVTELLLDVLDDCPALAGGPSQKRHRQE
ncbi:hypothetical protein BGX38DRAFT_1270482 [Terfezia claveryi]|nr:hypothetical protein BGX38DRAFT_1270482 [Terfezia claveryi]